MEILKECSRFLESGRNVAMATVIAASTGGPGKPGFKMIVTDDGQSVGTVGGGALEKRVLEECRDALSTGESRIVHYTLGEIGMLCGGDVDLVVEYLSSVERFLLFGGGHVGQALAPVLKSIGFTITVVDPRREMGEHFAESHTAEVVEAGYEDLSSVSQLIGDTHYCFVATHGHAHDYEVLRQLLTMSNEYRYIGLIGSRRKIGTTFQRLEEAGVAVPDCVYAPVGVPIGAKTAAEIAISVAAEVVAVRHGYDTSHMRLSEPGASD